MPRWLSWLVFLMLAYIVFQGNRAQHLPKATPMPVEQVTGEPAPQPVAKATSTPALDQATDMEHWKRAINPDYAKRTQCNLTAKESGKPALFWKVTEDSVGSGAGAKCGDTIGLKLTVWSAKGEASWQGESQFTLGAREIAAGLDAALVGIRKQGERTVILSGEALERDKKSAAAKPLLNAIGNGRVVIVTATRTE